MMRVLRKISFYFYPFYAVIHDFWKRNTDPERNTDHGTAPNQICGERGRVERYCPRARALGF